METYLKLTKNLKRIFIMKTTIYNLEKLISISVYDKRKPLSYGYSPEKKEIKKKFWGGYKTIITPACFWNLDIFSSPFKTLKELEKKENFEEGTRFLFEDNILYYKPEVVLCFTDGSKTIRRFDQGYEALEWAIEIKNTVFHKYLSISGNTWTILNK